VPEQESKFHENLKSRGREKSQKGRQLKKSSAANWEKREGNQNGIGKVRQKGSTTGRGMNINEHPMQVLTRSKTEKEKNERGGKGGESKN